MEITEDLERVYDKDVVRGADVARANGVKLSGFKKDIKKYLKTANNEDQWTYDYESYLLNISDGRFIEPVIWGREYYFGKWKF